MCKMISTRVLSGCSICCQSLNELLSPVSSVVYNNGTTLWSEIFKTTWVCIVNIVSMIALDPTCWHFNLLPKWTSMYTREWFGLEDYIQHLNNVLSLARLLLEAHAIIGFVSTHDLAAITVFHAWSPSIVGMLLQLCVMKNELTHQQQYAQLGDHQYGHHPKSHQLRCCP